MGNSLSATISAQTGTSSPLSESSTAETLMPTKLTPEIMHDPVILQITWAVAVVALIISLGKPIRDYLRGERRADKEDKVVDAKSSAESSLYRHLQEQVLQYRTIADQAFKERNSLIERVGALETKAESLEEQKTLVEKLKERLDKKDDEIHALLAQAAEERRQFLVILKAKDDEIARRDDRILSLERGQRELELRLASEERSTFVCPFNDRRRNKGSDGTELLVEGDRS